SGETGPLYFLAGAGQIKALESGQYLVDDVVRIRLRSGNATPVLRSSGGRQELLLPVMFERGKAEIVQEIDW
ncbi:MAG TPA: hypothetical protein PK867_01610, partial [Pirellulales bacterium]|nr:hypothetical protein [Pirellulales bacterium]